MPIHLVTSKLTQINIKESLDSKANKKINKGYPKEKKYSFEATDMKKYYISNLYTIYNFISVIRS